MGGGMEGVQGGGEEREGRGQKDRGVKGGTEG